MDVKSSAFKGPGIVDIELTNRCGASCGFCPRDKTPHQGLMTPETLARTLERVIELRAQTSSGLRGVSFCGLGDQLLHPQVAAYISRAGALGLKTVVNTNGSRLDEPLARALIDAGVDEVCINLGEIDEAYEELYHLSFERVRDNVARFVEMTAGGTIRLYAVLVNHQGDNTRVAEVRRYWRDLGVTRFFKLDLANRGGALEVEGMAFDDRDLEERARRLLEAERIEHLCAAPLAYPLVGYDGNYYLCSSDWSKEVPTGNVFEHSLLEVMPTKLTHLRTREPICRTCNHDPLNRVVLLLAALDAGTATEEDLVALIAELNANQAKIDDKLAMLRETRPEIDWEREPPTRARRRIPVHVASSDDTRSTVQSAPVGACSA